VAADSPQQLCSSLPGDSMEGKEEVESAASESTSQATASAAGVRHGAWEQRLEHSMDQGQ
jgi:hypothetical protein